MTWHLTASGHAATPDGETTSNRIEQRLLAELRAVLSKPEYGGTASLLRGTHVVSTGVHAPLPVAVVGDAAVSVERPAAAGRAAKLRTASASVTGE